MATLLHSESRRLYSWWWDSHISPKNSKWLQDNLADMDTKVKAMIKLIEEDADSFARRAEMYYKKRPELMKLVEEFYRAYRALAERYDHATLELRHAHRAMHEAFQNQLPFSPSGGSSSAFSTVLEGEPRTPEGSRGSRAVRALFDSDAVQQEILSSIKKNSGSNEESETSANKRGLKQLIELLASGAVPAGDFASELQIVTKALEDLRAEREVLNHEYQLSLQKLSNLEKEIKNAQKDAGAFDEQAGEAEIQIKILREALAKLKAEREEALLQYNQSLKKISNLEASISQVQEDSKMLNDRAFNAEKEAQDLKHYLIRLQDEKEAGYIRYKQCLEKISALENKIAALEENARLYNEQAERAEAEIEALKLKLSKLNEEKEAADFLHKQCLNTISRLESELFHFQEEAKRLNNEILDKASKLRIFEDECAILEGSNQSLRLEAETLAQKIRSKDQEVLEKQKKLEDFQTLLQDEHSRFEKVETSLKDLQSLHSESQEEQRALSTELENRLEKLKELLIRNQNLEDDLKQIKEDNRSLSELNSSSRVSLKVQESEISSLKEVKLKLEEEVARQSEQSNTLQQEVNQLKEQISDFSTRYQLLTEQIRAAGLDPENILSSVKVLHDDNSKLIEMCNNQRDEKGALVEKLKEMDDLSRRNTLLESSLFEANAKLDTSREKFIDLKDCCQSLRGEKADLAAERMKLLSHLQMMTENMQKLLEKNTMLENSLSSAKIELEGVRAKSKSLEEFCEFLKDEKSNLLKERESLVSQLQRVEERLSNLENRCTKLEEKYADLEKEKKSTLVQVEELRGSLVTEKQERASYKQSSEKQLADLQKHMRVLQEECKSRKKEFEEELDRAVNAQVEIFILQKFIEDLEQKNFSLLVECQKHVEASKFTDRLITDMENENLEQQMEIEFLLDEIQNLKNGIHQVLKTLRIDPVCHSGDKFEQKHKPISSILREIDEMKGSLSRNEEEKQHLVVENSVLLCLLGQLRVEGSELESEKSSSERDIEIMRRQYELLKQDNNMLEEMNKHLKLEVTEVNQREKALKNELENQFVKLETLQDAYSLLQKENFNSLDENRVLLRKVSELKKDICLLEEENSSALHEAISLSSMSLVYSCAGSDKAEEAKALLADLNKLQEINAALKRKVEAFEELLNKKEAETCELNRNLAQLQRELDKANQLNTEVKSQTLVEHEFLRQKAKDLKEAEQKLKAAHNINAELCEALEELKKEAEESKLIRGIIEKKISELVELAGKQEEEIKHLLDVNENLESEVDSLHQEIEEQRVREMHLSMELQEKTNEFGLWDAEATSFYFDLQISAVREVLLENKVHELTGVCENLKDENGAKSMEIKCMKEKVGSLEREVGELKTELSAYAPVLASLNADLESLEKSTFGLADLSSACHQYKQEEDHHEMSCQEVGEKRNNTENGGLLHLQRMQTRIRAIERAVAEEKNKLLRPRLSGSAISTKVRVKQEMKAEKEHEKMVASEMKRQKSKRGVSETKNGLLMKDIPLDQFSDSSFYGKSKEEISAPEDEMLELWESAEKDSTMLSIIKSGRKQTSPHRTKGANRKVRVPLSEQEVDRDVGVDKLELSACLEDRNSGGSREKILEQVLSDAQKLMSLEMIVKDLRRKMETNRRRKRSEEREAEKVKRQLKEIEEVVTQRVMTNNELTKGIKNRVSLEVREAGDEYRKRTVEYARRESEKIERLRFDVQSIERTVAKLEGDGKGKGKSRLSGSRTIMVLRDIMHKGGGKRSAKRKKSRFCACVKSPSTRAEQ